MEVGEEVKGQIVDIFVKIVGENKTARIRTLQENVGNEKDGGFYVSVDKGKVNLTHWGIAKGMDISKPENLERDDLPSWLLEKARSCGDVFGLVEYLD